MAVRHLYVHIPFCRSRCAYCDFASESVGAPMDEGRAERYLARLRSELHHIRPLLDIPVDTVYVGGGTPTMLPRRLLMDLVGDLAGLLRTGAEFTVEANPGTVDAALLEGLGDAGVTRLSIGVQSFSSRLREILGRDVSETDVEGFLEAVERAGWDDWNLDLIHGIPGQTWEESVTDIDRAVEAASSHISLYDLTYTERFRGYVAGLLGAEAEKEAVVAAEESYSQVVEHLEAAGYERYEVSNFALPGRACRHNQAYWAGEDYVGLGASAVSTVRGERRSNPSDVEAYLAGESPEIEYLSEKTRLWERAMLGLRTSSGVREPEVGGVIDQEAREWLLGQGLIEVRCGRLRLNPGFLDISSSIISTLLVSPDGS